MNVVTYSEARSSLKTLIDTVNNDADVTIISRRSGGDAVVMSLDHYQSLMETLHLVSTPANARALASAIAQDKAGEALRRELLKAEPMPGRPKAAKAHLGGCDSVGAG